MNFISQQDQENISIEALLQCVEAGNHDIEKFNSESAAMCLKMKSSIDNHRKAISHLINSLALLAQNENISFDELKSKLEKLCTTQEDFYEREYKKCCYSSLEGSTHIKSEQEEDDKESILLHSIHDTLDRRIKEYQHMISQQQQQQK